eukprot:TRINITY_DN10948_c0_g1_i1.p2 TRINITY_DN10948_c0_g1~~TRINITY_DN10948_c0_g1_i1.p2  ORF type:complete len:139 (-),score=49.27 TRINITY_DN10948_c0_g1_i1:39-455(-)
MLRSLVGSEMCIRDSTWDAAEEEQQLESFDALFFDTLLQMMDTFISQRLSKKQAVSRMKGLLSPQKGDLAKARGNFFSATTKAVECICNNDSQPNPSWSCLLYTSDAADEEDSVDLGGRRIIKKKKYDRIVVFDNVTL